MKITGNVFFIKEYFLKTSEVLEKVCGICDLVVFRNSGEVRDAPASYHLVSFKFGSWHRVAPLKIYKL